MKHDSCTGCPLFTLCLGDPESFLNTWAPKKEMRVGQCPYCKRVSIGSKPLIIDDMQTWCDETLELYLLYKEKIPFWKFCCDNSKCQMLRREELQRRKSEMRAREAQGEMAPGQKNWRSRGGRRR